MKKSILIITLFVVHTLAGLRAQEVASLEHDTDRGRHCSIVQVDSDTYVLAYEGINADGYIKTFTVSADGTTITQVASLEHDNSMGHYNSIVQVDSDTYVLAYAGNGYDGHISTFTISSDGTWPTEVASLEHDTALGTYNSLCQVDSDTYALAYNGTPNDGFIKTFTISSDGATITQVASLEHSGRGHWNSIVQVDSDTYVLAYTGDDYDGYIKTFTISSDGTSITEVQELEHDTDYGKYNSLCQVDSDTYVLAYAGPGDDGFIKTFTVSSDGETITQVASLEHDTDHAKFNSIIQVDSDTYVLAYAGPGDSDGFIKTFTISSDGTSITEVDELEHDTDITHDPGEHMYNSLCQVDSDTYVLAYAGVDEDGFIKTFTVASDGSLDVPTPPDNNHSLSFDGDDDYVSGTASTSLDVSNTNNLTITAWVKPADLNGAQRIISHHGNSYSQYALSLSSQAIYFFSGTDDFEQNQVNVSSSVLTINEWQHIGMTYDGEAIRLYLNSSLIFANYVVDNFSQDYIGEFFIGIRPETYVEDFIGGLDEISIWNTALTQDEMQSNMYSELIGNEEGLVGYWKFNEGDGDMLYDLSGNGNDGTIYGATWDEDGAPLEPNSIAVLTVHEVDGALGTTVSVPVDIELLGVDISSAEIRFSGFQDQLDFLGLDTEGTLIGDAGWEVEVNEQEDILITASAGANVIIGSGTLFRLNFDIPANSDEYFVPIYIIEAQLNEYTEPIDFVDGGVHIQYVMYGDVSQNGEVSAYDAALVLKYLVGFEELDENQLLAADVTLDGSVSALDASVILQYVAELIDGLPYDDVAGLAGTGDIGMEDGVFTLGDLLEIPIQLANGENLLSFEMDIAYDPEIVSFEMVDWSDMIEHFSIEENNESGLLRVAGSGSTPDGIEGVFGSLQVFVDGGFEGESFEISISTYRINENEPVDDIIATFTNSALGLDHNSIPEVFALHQNYPNPFNPVTTLRYDVPKDELVNIAIYDMMGRVVRTLVNMEQNAGFKSIQWNATNNAGQPVSAGLYLYTIQAGEFRQTKKMVLLK